MKKSLLLTLVAFTLFACHKTNDNTGPLDQFIVDNYSEDARQILFRLLQGGAVTTDKDKPEFNQTER